MALEKMFVPQTEPRVMCFDIDDVILNTDGIRHDLKQHAAMSANLIRKLGRATNHLPGIETPQGFYHYANNYSVEKLNELGVNDLILSLIADYKSQLRHCDLKPIDGALDIIDKLCGEGITVRYLSKGDHRQQKEKLVKLGLNVSGDHVYATGRFAYVKIENGILVPAIPNKAFPFLQMIGDVSNELGQEILPHNIRFYDDKERELFVVKIVGGAQCAQIAIPGQTPQRETNEILYPVITDFEDINIH